MKGWEPKEYTAHAPNSIWYGKSSNCWFVNYIGEEIHGSFGTWQEAMDFLCDELQKVSPMEVS